MPIHGYPGNVITANPTAPTSSVATGVWTTEQQLQAVSQGNWPGYEYPISRSLRFNSADSAYLNRTPASAGNRKTWTWSGWVKRGQLGSRDIFFAAGTAGNNFGLEFSANNELEIYQYVSTYQWQLISSSVYRDVSAWYHIVLALDTTQATASNRVKLYVNGVQVTAFSTSTYPTQNTDYLVNSTSQHNISDTSGASLYYDGYMTEVNFIDGQALTPSSFGLNDPDTGVWFPKRYTGAYGTNGFYLNFSDNSGTTSTTLGKDSSGNGNNWTPNNFSVTAGAGNDSMVDSPTSYGTDTGLGGEVRGNYCTANPLKKPSTSTITNGNLDVAHTSAGGEQPATFAFSSGKWYWEVSPNSGFAAYGIILTSVTPSASSINNGYHYYGGNGQFYTGTSGVAYGATFTNGDVIGVALNLDTNQITFYKNGVSQGAQSISAGEYFPDIGAASTTTTNCNFGQRAFAYTAPSGFKALCTTNLPTPTIGATSTTQANDYMNVVLYTGDGANPRTVSGVGFQPDFVWTKSRSSAFDHWLFDAVRGATKTLTSNSTSAEITYANSLKSFISDGFTVGDLSDINANGGSYVAWNWKANGAGGSNTAGTITSTVSANTTSGFSVGTFTGGGAGSTIGHGLGVAPRMIIVKDRVNAGSDWCVYTATTGAGAFLKLNTTAASAADTTMWGNTSPISTVFTWGYGSGVNYVFYAFAPVAGYSAFGSYTGDGSTDGPFVYTGFRPRYVLIKNYTTSGNGWIIIDTARSTYNTNALQIYASSSAAESSSTAYVDILSNGFKLKSGNSDINNTGVSYIYAAFAESPFKYSLAR